jgi:cytochrome c peroxidase
MEDSFDIRFPPNTEKTCATPGGAAVSTAVPCQIALSAEDRGKANNAYDNWAQPISKHERSPRISAFSAKFDAFLAGSYPPTADEMTGYNLFKGKG